MYHQVSLLTEQKKQIEQALEHCNISLCTFQPNKHEQSSGKVYHEQSSGKVCHEKSPGKVYHEQSSSKVYNEQSSGKIYHEQSSGKAYQNQSTFPRPYPLVLNKYKSNLKKINPFQVSNHGERYKFVNSDRDMRFKKTFRQNMVHAPFFSGRKTTWIPQTRMIQSRNLAFIDSNRYYTDIQQSHHRNLQQTQTPKSSYFRNARQELVNVAVPELSSCNCRLIDSSMQNTEVGQCFNPNEINASHFQQQKSTLCSPDDINTHLNNETQDIEFLPTQNHKEILEDSSLDILISAVEDTFQNSMDDKLDDYSEVIEDESEVEDYSDSSEDGVMSTSRACISAIPFKKRKHTERYPKSRFIDASKIPIFDLTLEEEFRIFDISFRRDLTWKSYIKSMKETVPNFESFKTNIFLSAFGWNRVVTKPEDWSTWTFSAVKNHVKSAELFDEISELPSHIWDKIKVENTKTWSTYSWALCWANVDSENLIEQESKAGFWSQELQVQTLQIHMILNTQFKKNYYLYIYKVVIFVCLPVCPIINQKPNNRFGSYFDYGRTTEMFMDRFKSS